MREGEIAIPLTRRRFSVDDYYRMAAAGIFSEDDRVELIEGEIVEMAPIGSRHAAQVDKLNWIFLRRVGDRAIISVQNPLRLGTFSEPVPDLVLLLPRPDFYASGHPGPRDALLVVEVADTTLEYDRGVKIPLYARYGIPEVWLVDLRQGAVETYQNPTPDAYLAIRTFRRSDQLTPSPLPEVALLVDDILV
jgi:Uma2 family endonuclease